MIPTLEEAENVAGAIRSAPPGAEVIVVDGGSGDGTARVAAGAGARVLSAPRGRALQLNRGARAAGGEWMLFLHADCRLPEDAASEIRRVLRAPGVVGGWFPLRIASGGRLLRLGARGSNLRARCLRLPYGDQAIFARRKAFLAAGGFPDDPIMEDAGLARRLRRLGRLAPAAAPVTTNAGHWERLGPVLTAVLDYAALAAWLLGAPPRWIAGIYFPLHCRHRHRRPP